MRRNLKRVLSAVLVAAMTFSTPIAVEQTSTIAEAAETVPVFTGIKEKKLEKNDVSFAYKNPLKGSDSKKVTIEYTINLDKDAAANGWDGIMSFFDASSSARVSIQTFPYLCWNSQGLKKGYIDYNYPLNGTNYLSEKGKDSSYKIEIDSSDIKMYKDNKLLDLKKTSGDGSYSDILNFINSVDDFYLGVGLGKYAFWNTELCTLKNVHIYSDTCPLAKINASKETNFKYDTDADFDGVLAGSDVSFKVTPDTGYEVAGVSYNGTELTPAEDGTYTIKSVTDNADLKVSVKNLAYPVNVYVDGKADSTLSTSFKSEDLKDEVYTLPELPENYEGWYLTDTDRTNKITSVDGSKYMNDAGLTLYAYAPHKVDVSAVKDVEGLDWKALKDNYYLGNEVIIPTTDKAEEGKVPSVTIKAGENEIESYVISQNGKMAVKFEMPASDVTIENVSFGDVNKDRLTSLIENKETNYADNSSTVAGVSTKYTAKTWDALTDAYETAVTVSKKEAATQVEVDAAVSGLQNAIKNLTYLYVLDTPSSFTIEKGDSKDFSLKVLSNATDKKVTWKSSDEKVVTVENGVLTAIDKGTATITAKAEDGTETAIAVTVKISLTNIKLTDTSLIPGDKQQFRPALTPSDATVADISWTSTNPEVASVNASGIVTAKSLGKTTITVSADGLSSSCVVAVKNEVKCPNRFAEEESPRSEVTAEGTYITFDTKTEKDATEVYNIPSVNIVSENGNESWTFRADGWNWGTTGENSLKYSNVGKKLSDDINAWLSANKAGTKGFLSAVQNNNEIVLRFTIANDIKVVTIPITQNCPYYVSLVGELCNITNIKAVSKDEFAEPAPIQTGSVAATPKPASTPAPEVDVPLTKENVKADFTQTSEAWWTVWGEPYTVNTGDATTELYAVVDKTIGGAADFAVQIWNDKDKYVTSNTLGDTWGDGFSEVVTTVPKTETLIEGHVYRVSVTRKGTDLTIRYYDATAMKDFYVVTLKNFTLGDSLNMRINAEFGTFSIGQSLDLTATPAPTTTGSAVTGAPTDTATTAPTTEPSAAPTSDPGVTTAPTTAPSTEPTTAPATVKKGDKVTVSGAKYVATSSKEVSYTAAKKATASVVIPATVKVKGKTLKVTSIAAKAFKGNKTVKSLTVGKNVTTIGANAFNGCKKLKTLTIKSTKLSASKIAKNAFKGISKKTTVKVPKNKLKAYKKLLRKKGLAKSVGVKSL